MAITKADFSKLNDDLRFIITEEIKDAMMEFKTHILRKIRQMQKSIEDPDAKIHRRS